MDLVVINDYQIVSGSWDGYIIITDLITGKILKIIDFGHASVHKLAALPDNQLAFSAYGNSIKIFDSSFLNCFFKRIFEKIAFLILIF